MTIGDFTLTPHGRVMVIAEIGVNHDGKVRRALELVHAAADAGADAVKLQLFSASRLVDAHTALAEYQQGNAQNQQELLGLLELSEAETGKVVKEIRRCGMIPLATPFSIEDVATVASLELPAIKIASPDLVNLPLLRAAMSLGKPLLLSTGASERAEIDRTVSWLDAAGHGEIGFALMHCVSSYPTSDQDANLAWIAELSRAYLTPVGYSDHTENLLAGALAVGVGACVIEKHLTHDRAAPGPDHSASFDPVQFAHYVQLIRAAELMRGSDSRVVLPCEQDVRRVSRQSLVLRCDVKRGQVLSEDDLCTRRPGDGIDAGSVDLVIGSRAARNLSAGVMLHWEDLRPAAKAA